MSKELKEVKTIDEKDIGEEPISWEPASNLQNVMGLDSENFVYRWVNREDPQNFKKKQKEGWIIDNTIEGSNVEHTRAKTLETGANPSSSVKDLRGMILMKMPRKLAEARKKYYDKKAADQLSMVTHQQTLKNEGQGVIYGDVKVEIS